MNKGILYGIGVGPGDPRLLTFKAVDTIRKCDVIAVPEPDGAERTAFAVVEEYLDGKTILPCRFSMHCDERMRGARRFEIGERICTVLETKKSVGFVTLGDPMIYSTYAYVLEYVLSRGFEAETVPGVTSFCAAAAALNRPLCEGRESLHLLSGACDEDVEPWLDLPGTKMIMKSGKSLPRLLALLRRRGFADRTSLVSRCTMEGQIVLDTIDKTDPGGNNDDVEYFSVLIVKEKKP